MKATEARANSQAAITGDLSEVYHAIKWYSDFGDFSFHVYFFLREDQISELRDKGYNVVDVTKDNEPCFRISW